MSQSGVLALNAREAAGMNTHKVVLIVTWLCIAIYLVSHSGE